MDKTATISKTAFVALCKAHGVMALDQVDSLSIDAPTGFVFMGTGLHSRTLYWHHDGWTKTEAYAELASDLANGVEPCGDPDCDCCVHERMTFDQIAALHGGERIA
jgi:hypothetical protein